MAGETIARIDREVELQAMTARIAEIAPKLRTFQGIRRVCARRWQRSPNWVLAMDVFGVGSTYAYAICREMGIDPDSRSAKAVAVSTPAPSHQSGEGWS